MPDDSVDIEWLVTERCRIQHLSARLLLLMHANDLTKHECLDGALLMVGAAFSL
jgi:hypothetical protein